MEPEEQPEAVDFRTAPAEQVQAEMRRVRHALPAPPQLDTDTDYRTADPATVAAEFARLGYSPPPGGRVRQAMYATNR